MLRAKESLSPKTAVNDVYGGNHHTQDSKAAVIHTISELFGLEEHPVPKVGEFLLINECAAQYSRIHGGRYNIGYYRRYFGRVVEVYPHIIVLDSGNRMTSERVDDFKVGLVRYVRLKRLPESPEKISYDEKLLSRFIHSFENLLLE